MQNIIASSLPSNMEPGKIVSKFGRLLYDQIYTVLEADIKPNNYKVYFESDGEKYCIDLSSYGDKLRMNLINLTEGERTISHDSFNVKDFKDYPDIRHKLIRVLYKRVNKALYDPDIFDVATLLSM